MSIYIRGYSKYNISNLEVIMFLEDCQKLLGSIQTVEAGQELLVFLMDFKVFITISKGDVTELPKKEQGENVECLKIGVLSYKAEDFTKVKSTYLTYDGTQKDYTSAAQMLLDTLKCLGYGVDVDGVFVLGVF